VAGETIDYGPCAFMDSFHPGTVYSSIDHAGRYAYANQPSIAYWNLARLAETLLPLLAPETEAAIAEAHAALDAYPAAFEHTYHAGLRAKLGLFVPHDDDIAVARDLFAAMDAEGADFTLIFRALCDAVAAPDAMPALFGDSERLRQWVVAWRARLTLEDVPGATRAAAMRTVNPAFIPRNHRVQAAIAAAQSGDFSVFEELLRVLAHPYDAQPEFAAYAAPPRPEEVVRETFCGT
jgi:uncharacterized protein YdiU (UPF0061 family)